MYISTIKIGDFLMFQYVAIGILAIAAIIVVANIVIYLFAGLKKSLGALVAIVLAAVIALVLTSVICSPTSSLVESAFEASEDFLTENEFEIFSEVEALGEAITYYVAMLVAPFFFMGVFVLLSIILTVVMTIVAKFIPIFKNTGFVAKRLGGAGVGLVCGLIVALIVVMPFVGTVNVVASAADSLMEEVGESEDSEIEDSEVVDVIHDAAENSTFAALGTVCDPVYNSLSSARFEGENVYLSKDLEAIINIVGNISALEGEVAEYGDRQINALNDIVSNLDTSPLLENTVAGIFSAAADSWLDNESFMGMEKINAGETLEPLVTDMLEVISTTDYETVSADLQTMADVFGVLIRYDMLKGEESGDLVSNLSREGAISELIIAINKNPRMIPLADDVVKLSVETLATSVKIPHDADRKYPDSVTVEDILADLGSFGNCEDIEAEAKAVEEAMIKALDSMDDLNGDGADVSRVISLLGEMLDSLNKTEVFGGGATEKMLKAILQSDSVTSALGLSHDQISSFADKVIEKVNTTDMDYTAATKAVAGTLNALKSATDENMSVEEKKEATQELISNITTDSADMLSSMLSTSMIEDMGVSEEKSESVTSAINSMIDKMAQYNESAPEGTDTAKEAEAVNQILNMAINITPESTEGSIFNGEEEGALGCTADELVDLIVNSEVVSATVKETVHENGYSENPLGLPELSESDREQAEQAIADYYVSNGGGEELASTLEAIAAIINVQVDLEK